MGTTARNFIKNLTIAGIGDGQASTVFCMDPLIPDQHFVHEFPKD
jgi:hypothetical protein